MRMAKTTPFRTIKTKKHPHYWKLKSAFLENRQIALNARATVDAANAKLHQVMKDAGLDPAKHYNLSDTDESITPAPDGAELPPV